jgi:hypothetical protein
MTTRAARILSRAQAWPVRAALLALLITAAVAQLGDACGAQAQAEMMSVGQEMLRLSETTGPGPGDRVLLNGAELQVNRGRTQRTVVQLLAQAEANCAGEAMRGGDTSHGFVSCGAADAGGSLTLPIAYVYAERRGPTTHYIGIDSPRPVELGALFPREGDAPGQDPTALPRPRSSRRAFSLFVAGRPYQAAVYLDDERQFDDLVAHYRSALPRAGWKVIARWKTDEGLGPRQASVVIERAGVLALLLVSQDRAETTTTFLTMEANREQ